MPDSGSYPDIALDANFPDAQFYNKIGLLSNTLQQRNFGTMHFFEVENLLKQIRARLTPDHAVNNTIRLWGRSLSDQEVSNTFIFYRPLGPRYDQPVFMNLGIRENQFTYSEIPFPFLIRAGSGHFRRAQRSADQSEADGLMAFLGMTLALSKVLEGTPEFERKLQSKEGMRVFLSDTAGLYLCRAHKMNDDELDPQINIWCERKNGRGIIENSQPAWIPSVKITAYSHLPTHELNPFKVEIYEELDEFQQDSDIQKVLRALHLRFTNPNSRADAKTVDETINRMKALLLMEIANGTATRELRETVVDQISVLTTAAKGDGPLIDLVMQLTDIVNGPRWAGLSDAVEYTGPSIREDRSCFRPPETSLAAVRQLSQVRLRY